MLLSINKNQTNVKKTVLEPKLRDTEIMINLIK